MGLPGAEPGPEGTDTAIPRFHVGAKPGPTGTDTRCYGDPEAVRITVLLWVL